MEQDFDWGELGRDWWLATAHSIGATERHAKFSAAKHRGASNAEAARSAGFGTGSESSVRSEGYRLARANKINQLLALAAAEAGGGYDGTLTRTESKQILTNLARGSDPSIRIKAVEAIAKFEQAERDEQAIDADAVREPADVLNEIDAEFSPVFSAVLAMQHGIGLSPERQAALDAICPVCRPRLFSGPPKADVVAEELARQS